MADSFSSLLADLLAFVHDEQRAAHDQLLETWHLPLTEKIERGLTQAFTHLEPASDPNTLWACLDAGDSRFRAGDLLALHRGKPLEETLARGFTLEAEEDGRWLLRGARPAQVLAASAAGPCFADPDAIDLTPLYERALQDIAAPGIGRDVVLPLLAGVLPITFDDRDVSAGIASARAAGLNAKQADAVGLAFGAEQVACIQGPPGTGKTRVLAFAVRLMVERGERVLVTSHTHMAINNALNRIRAEGVPVVKVGRETHRVGLDERIPCHGRLAAWEERPTNGYVVGATPFATGTSRLEGHEFDVVVFDEASQVTVPLALMAMRKARRFVFIGDPRQLPPVMLSRSVLSGEALSVFAALTSRRAEHSTMLVETYRLNRWLAEWPSRRYYASALVAAGPNRERRLRLARVPPRLAAVLACEASGVFVATRDRAARSRNEEDAALVADLCLAAVEGGLAPSDIGIVTPYRAQGRAVRGLLQERLGRAAAREIVADTVERMQGQERELVILSLATGDTMFLGLVAPFFFQPERLNVAITRPMTKLVVIGPDADALPRTDDATLAEWIAQYRDLVAHLERAEVEA